MPAAPVSGTRAVNAVTAAAAALARTLAAAARRMRRQTSYRPEASDWIWYVGVPAVAYLALGAAAALCAARPAAALYVVGSAALLMLVVGIHNAWDSATYIAAGPPASPAAAPPPRPRLRRQRVEQFGDVRHAIAGDRRFIEFGLGLDVGVELPRQPRRGDDNLVPDIIVIIVLVVLRRGNGGIGGLFGHRRNGG